MQTWLNPVSLGNLVYWGAVAVWGLPEVAGAFRRRRTVHRQDAVDKDRGSYFLLVAALWVGFFIAGYISRSVPEANLGWNRPVIQAVAAAVILLGVAFRWNAIRILGRYFTQDVAVSANQQLVQAGPYRLIRHPAYTGTLIVAVGFGLGMVNGLSLMAAVTGFLIGHLYRIHVEERALAALIGPPYLDYMRRTKRLIPFIF